MFSEKNCCRNEFRSFAGVRFGRFQAGIRLCGATVSTEKRTTWVCRALFCFGSYLTGRFYKLDCDVFAAIVP